MTDLIKNKNCIKSIDQMLDYYSFDYSDINIKLGDFERAIKHPIKINNNDIIKYEKNAGKCLDLIFLNNGIYYLRAASHSFLAYKNLQLSGYNGWSKIIRYYSRFLTITSLLRLQGIGILFRRINKPTPRREPRTVFDLNFSTYSSRKYALLRTNLNTHEYSCYYNPGSIGNGHEGIWNLARKMYKHFQTKDKILTKGAIVENNSQDDDFYYLLLYNSEDIRRNEINYSIYGFDELDYFSPEIFERTKSLGNMNLFNTNIWSTCNAESLNFDALVDEKKAIELLKSAITIYSLIKNNNPTLHHLQPPLPEVPTNNVDSNEVTKSDFIDWIDSIW